MATERKEVEVSSSAQEQRRIHAELRTKGWVLKGSYEKTIVLVFEREVPDPPPATPSDEDTVDYCPEGQEHPSGFELYGI